MQELKKVVVLIKQGMIEEARIWGGPGGQFHNKKFHSTEKLAEAMSSKLDLANTPQELYRTLIRIYTAGGFWYKVVNETLRTSDLSKVDTIAPYVYLVDLVIVATTCSNSPRDSRNEIRHLGVSYRKLNLEPDQVEFLDELKSSAIVFSLYSFISTSIYEESAQAFSGNTLMVFITATQETKAEGDAFGLAIDDLSEFPGENEVLFRPSAEYRLVGFEKGPVNKLRLQVQPKKVGGYESFRPFILE